jgi:hypothetical protein
VKSKRTFYGLSSAAALATVLVFSVAVAGQLDQPVTASSSYTLTFNASNGAFSNSTSSSSLYQNTDARTSSGAAIAVNYYQAKAASSYYAELSSGGYLYVPNGLTGLTSITVNFVDRGSGGLSLYASDCPSFQGSATALTSGTPVSLHFNYFKLLAPSSVVDVVSIVCKYTCQTATNSSTQSTTNYLYFHYHRSDATYTLNSKAYGTWVWTSGSGTQYAFDQSDSYGVYWALPLSTWGTTTTLNYIVHPAGDWDNKDPGGDEVFSLGDFTADANGNYSVYKLSGKSGVYASSVLAMAASSETTPTTPTTPSDGSDKGLILHCFDWSLATIESNLNAIAAAGYTAIQTSPMQQCKDYSASWTDTSGQWWKLYQPIAFSIATSSWIGTTSTLTSLCTAAKAKGIKIIVDVVANHMAGGSSSNTPDSGVATYESYIYNNQSSTFHTYKAADWNDTSTYTITHENICCPDLNTANAYVQSRVLSYLKSCIDCGVSGFRFDAAKHIELPSDGTSASDFWTNTAVAAKTYATSKGITLFNYGEVLDSPGSSRSRADYDNYLDALTDNSVGYNVLNGVYNTNASTSSSPSYNSNQAASKTVLWAESHDTYLNSGGFSSGATQDQIDLAWGVVAARANAHCLYFVRPGSTMNSTLNTAYLSGRVKAINSFHNAMISATSEYLSNDGYHLVGVERSDGSSLFGMSIIDVSGYSGSLSMTTHLIANGTYTDLYSGNTFTVSNNRVSGTMNNGVACLIQA